MAASSQRRAPSARRVQPGGVKYLVAVSCLHLVVWCLSLLLFDAARLVFGRDSDAVMTRAKIAVFCQALNCAMLYVLASLIADIEDVKMPKPAGIVARLVYCGSVFASCTAVFHLIAILYGAPVFEHIDRTCLFAILLSSTAILPPLCILGSSLNHWMRVFVDREFSHALEAMVFVTSVMSVVGAWMGAFPIPLDWDRWWQVWPNSCMIGNVIGYFIGLTWVTASTIMTKTGKKSS